MKFFFGFSFSSSLFFLKVVCLGVLLQVLILFLVVLLEGYSSWSSSSGLYYLQVFFLKFILLGVKLFLLSNQILCSVTLLACTLCFVFLGTNVLIVAGMVLK